MAYDPNLSIIVPGPCNAKCGFCFWKDTKNVDKNYAAKLKAILNEMPIEFHQISLTGGEPTLSEYLPDIFMAIDRNQYDKVVLTTNGAKLISMLRDLKIAYPDQKLIDHINISRHHFNDAINASIFNSKSIIDVVELRKAIKACHEYGTDVTINCVLTDYLKSKKDIDVFLNWAKYDIEADAVCFRKQHGTLEPSPQENMYKKYTVISEGSCPVCRTKVQDIDGQMIIWKASRPEPSEVVGDDLYEVIIHPECKVTLDWAGNKPYIAKKDMSMDSRDEQLAKIADALISIGNALKNMSQAQPPIQEKDSLNDFPDYSEVSYETEKKQPTFKTIKQKPTCLDLDRLGSDDVRVNVIQSWLTKVNTFSYPVEVVIHNGCGGSFYFASAKELVKELSSCLRLYKRECEKKKAKAKGFFKTHQTTPVKSQPCHPVYSGCAPSMCIRHDDDGFCGSGSRGCH